MVTPCKAIPVLVYSGMADQRVARLQRAAVDDSRRPAPFHQSNPDRKADRTRRQTARSVRHQNLSSPRLALSLDSTILASSRGTELKICPQRFGPWDFRLRTIRIDRDFRQAACFSRQSRRESRSVPFADARCDEDGRIRYKIPAFAGMANTASGRICHFFRCSSGGNNSNSRRLSERMAMKLFFMPLSLKTFWISMTSK